MKRLIPGALSALILAVALGACASGSSDQPAGDATADPAAQPAAETAAPASGDLGGREIVVGTDATYEPFEFTDDAGKIVGVDPDIMTAICQIANCKPRFVATAWDGIFAALKSGEFDALMSSITILPERETESGAHFTVPYHSIGQVILVRADNSTVTGVAALPQAVVGVQTGTTGDTAATAKALVPEDKMRRFETVPLAIQALRNGDIDAVVLDSVPAEKAAKDTAEPRLMVAGEPFTQEDYGILVPDKSPELLEAFNAAIAQMQDSGQLATIVGKWLTE
ncbi:MAG: transporter substrate-binding domain-containing protein [Anaerolineae bacterium]|nr:transporter substrate-binding domain-containing protein [Ardenticatenia bacterium]HRA20652.1 transporter substrate-binding domain-containing protein [Anaerolineae bacterium]